MSISTPAWFVDVDEVAERAAAALRRTPLEPAAHLVSSAADRSLLWLGMAALRVARDRDTGVRAAVRMMMVVGTQTMVLHGGVKRLFRRQRPTSVGSLRFGARRPPSSSFPSGHAASAATAAVLLAEGDDLGPLIGGLALLVAWSRVQTGLHHATDVAGGLVVGTATGVAARRLWPLDR